jgi:hypothetical protein
MGRPVPDSETITHRDSDAEVSGKSGSDTLSYQKHPDKEGPPGSGELVKEV